MKHLVTAYRGVIRALHERPEMLQLPQKLRNLHDMTALHISERP